MRGRNLRPRFAALLWVVVALLLVPAWRDGAVAAPATPSAGSPVDLAVLADQAQPAALPRKFPRNARVEAGVSRPKPVPSGPESNGTAIVPDRMLSVPAGQDDRSPRLPALLAASTWSFFQARAPPPPVA